MGRRLQNVLAHLPMMCEYAAGMLTCDGLGGAALAGRDHDEHFHDIVVDPDDTSASPSPLTRNMGNILAAAALHNEDILIAD